MIGHNTETRKIFEIMSYIKRFILMALLVIMPVSMVAQQSRGDQLYSEAITLMENGSKTSLNKAISTLKKAKLAYESSANKSKCDAKIKECQSLLRKGKSDSSSSASTESGNRKQAEQYYKYAVEEQQKGNITVALEYFNKAKKDFPASDAAMIAKCDEGIAQCSKPLKFEKEVLTIPCQGDVQNVAVISNLTGNWLITPVGADWVHATMSGNGISFDVDENETNQHRECKVTISHSDKYTADLTIVQHGSIDYKIDDEDDDVFYLKFKNNDKSKLLVTNILVPDNSSWEILRDSTDAWIFPEVSTNSIGVTVSKHNGKEGRTGRIGMVYKKDDCQNITYIPVFQGTKMTAKVTNGMKKGWKSFTKIFTGK